MKNVTYINAGAGSGKNYTLTNILAARLSGKFYAGEQQSGNPIKVNPTEIILTTFTELAATEFREKARQEILKSGKLDAAAQIDSAAIGTVHSVALRFIKRFWYLLEYGAEIQTISERDEDFYLSQSLARIVALPDNQADLTNFRIFRDHYDICDGYNHPDYLFWQRILNDVVEKMEYYNVNEVEESIKRSIETLKIVFNGNPIDYNFIAEGVKEYADFCSRNKKSDGDKADRCHKEATRLLKNKKDKSWLGDVNRLFSDLCKATTAQRECSKLTESISKLAEADISTSELDVLEPFVKSIFKIAKAWREDYVAYKQNNHIISYNDMERLFLKLLDEEEVKDYIKTNYKLVMVDEFQDSNPIQLKIFNLLSEIVAEGGGHSYWVGDPKQAIYGFRGADTDLVNSVATHFNFYNDALIHPEEGCRSLGSGRLVESWRSRAKLVKLVNESFYEPFKKDGINDLLIKLDPHFATDNLNSEALVHWNIEVKNSADLAYVLAINVKKMLESRMMVHHGLQDTNPSEITYKDIAILCRQNDKCKEIVKALRKIGVPVSESEDAIMQRVEVQLVVTLLQFMQNPHSKHTIASLKRLLLGESTKDILRDRIDYVQSLKEDEKDEWQLNNNFIIQLTKDVNRYKNLAIPDMVRAVIHECNVPALCAKWGEESTRKQNLSALQHLADEYDQMCLQMGLGTSISGFIYFLNTIEPDKERDNQSNTVKVFTYHTSKGLEWPVVIMHGLENDTTEDADFTKKQYMKVREVVLEDRSSEENPFDKDYYLHYFPNVVKPGGQSKPSAALQDKICALDFYKEIKERSRSEERRLLYVGMTRAKDYLYTIGYKSQYNWLKVAGIEGSADENVWAKPSFAPHCETLTKPDEQEISSETPQYVMVEKPCVHDERSPRYLSPSKLEKFDGYNTHSAWKDRGTEIEHRGWGNEYAQIGSCIHDIFAVYNPDSAKQTKEWSLRIIGNYGLAEKLAGHVDAILRSADWLYEALQAKYPRTENDTVDKEFPFMMTIDSGQTLRGEMDLLWHYTDDSGQHCVLVDYKTFPGVDLNSHTKEYYPQLSAYASALSNSNIEVSAVLLYYPIHGVIHEMHKG